MNAVMTELPILVPCKHCGRELYQPQLRRALLECPVCFPPAVPRGHDAFRSLARRERQRVRTIVAAQLIPVIAEIRSFPRYPPELLTTVRVLDRWGSFGSGRPAENPDLYRDSMPVPLDPDTQAIVTECVGPDPRARVNLYEGSVPVRVRAVTYDIWWRGAAPSFVGEKHGMKPRTFGRYCDDCLRMHRRAFLESKHSDLVDLIEAQP